MNYFHFYYNILFNSERIKYIFTLKFYNPKTILLEKEIIMTVHSLKTWTEYYNFVVSGEKTFEVRRNDRNFQKGDILRLEEYIVAENKYTGRHVDAEVTYILNGGQFGIEAGNVIMGLKILHIYEVISEITKSVDKSKDEENPSEPPTLENKIDRLEHKIDTLWTEVFSAWHGTIGKDSETSRTTLKGTVDKLCSKITVEPVTAPWIKKVNKPYSYEITDPTKLRSCSNCSNLFKSPFYCSKCIDFSKYISR
jgi:hypothetical protein